MTKFILKSIVFSLPFILYLSIATLVDPYNYFGVSSMVSTKVKSQISYPLNSPLWKLIEFKKLPSPNILLGDSRMGILNEQIIKEYTGVSYYKFNYAGGTIEEAVSTFWEADKLIKLERVIIGINFNSFNGNNIRNRVTGVITTSNSWLLYLTNRNVLESTYLIIKNLITDSTVQIEKPNKSKMEFWEYKLNVTARRFYANYKFPLETYNKLEAIIKYCDENNIRITFVILPTHISLQEKIIEYGLREEWDHFILDIRKLGEIYNFDYPNAITRNQNYFLDPFHLSPSKKHTMLLVKDIFGNKRPLYAKYFGRTKINEAPYPN